MPRTYLSLSKKKWVRALFSSGLHTQNRRNREQRRLFESKAECKLRARALVLTKRYFSFFFFHIQVFLDFFTWLAVTSSCNFSLFKCTLTKIVFSAHFSHDLAYEKISRKIVFRKIMGRTFTTTILRAKKEVLIRSLEINVIF